MQSLKISILFCLLFFSWTIEAKKIEPKVLISHHFKFEDILEAYTNFEHAAETKAIKIIIDV